MLLLFATFYMLVELLTMPLLLLAYGPNEWPYVKGRDNQQRRSVTLNTQPSHC